MNNRHRRTLADIFADPVRANIEWGAIENLFIALGGTVEERAGSRVSVTLNGIVRVFHRPHPGNESKKPTVRSARDFLIEAGVQP